MRSFQEITNLVEEEQERRSKTGSREKENKGRRGSCSRTSPSAVVNLIGNRLLERSARDARRPKQNGGTEAFHWQWSAVLRKK